VDLKTSGCSGATSGAEKRAFHGDLLEIWGWVKTLVPLVNPKIAGIYGCSSH